MLLRNYSKTLKKILLIGSLSILTACSATDRVVVQTQVVRSEVPIQTRPKPVSLSNIKFYVVTKDNLNGFLKTYEKEHVDIVFYAISVKDYEKVALNIAELRRYINQQDKIIVYYENAIKSQQTSNSTR